MLASDSLRAEEEVTQTEASPATEQTTQTIVESPVAPNVESRLPEFAQSHDLATSSAN